MEHSTLLSEKRAIVYAWLSNVFAPTSQVVPEFEDNEQTVDFLYQLAKSVDQKEKEYNYLISEYQRQTVEYRKRGNSSFLLLSYVVMDEYSLLR
jgi:hypothetical protein